jgi:radical SAM protein with 4Fe4S-binding SPASM domain
MPKRMLEANAANLIAVYPKVLQILNGEIPLPEVVELFINNNCNFACPHCRCAEQHGSATEFMDVDILNRLLNELSEKDMKTIELGGGGEPLDHPRIAEILGLFCNGSFRVGLITNGYRLIERPELIDLLINCGDWIRFSLDAVSDDIYKIVHGINDLSYSALRAVIIGIVGRIRKKSVIDRRPKIGVKLIVQQPNEQQIMKAVDEAVELGVDYLQFKWLEENPWSIPDERRASLASELLRKIEELPANSLFVDVLAGYGGPKVHSRCVMSVLHPVIDWDGKVYMCAFFNHRKEKHAIGNIAHERFFDCWGSAIHHERILQVDPQQCVSNCPLLRYNPVIDFICEEAFRFRYI